LTELIEIPNYIEGSFEKTEKKKILTDLTGKPIAELYGATDSLIRKAKRALVKNSEEIGKIGIPTIIEVLKRSMDYYYDKDIDFKTTALLAGSPISFVRQEIDSLKTWCKNIDEYLYSCFGCIDYTLTEIKKNGKLIGYRKFVPNGPITAILPKNDDGLPLYVLTQLILSRNTAIVKPSSEGASSFATIKFIEALNKSIDYYGPEEQKLKNAIQVVNILEERENKIRSTANLVVTGGQVIIFGTENTARALSAEISNDTKINKIIKMGTGFSISIVLNDADVNHAATEIVHSSTQDKGNKCTTTNVVYVEGSVYPALIKKLRETEKAFKHGELLAAETRLGLISEEEKKQIIGRIKELYGHTSIGAIPNYIEFKIHEIESHDPVEEMPAPVIFLKKLNTEEDIIKQTLTDIRRNELEKNLVTSIYTKNFEKFEKLTSVIPSHTFKLNKSSEKINFLLEHQGQFLIQELLDKKILEV